MPVADYDYRSTVKEPAFAKIPVSVCNLDYLDSISRGNKERAQNFVVAFFTEIQEELEQLKLAIEETNFSAISKISHKMKSAFAILGVTTLEPVIKEMEQLSLRSSSIEKIWQLGEKIIAVFTLAKIEMKLPN